jgi:hypothetical protein
VPKFATNDKQLIPPLPAGSLLRRLEMTNFGVQPINGLPGNHNITLGVWGPILKLESLKDGKNPDYVVFAVAPNRQRPINTNQKNTHSRYPTKSRISLISSLSNLDNSTLAS